MTEQTTYTDRAECPHCHRDFKVRANGELARHRTPGNIRMTAGQPDEHGSQWCDARSMTPAEGTR